MQMQQVDLNKYVATNETHRKAIEEPVFNNLGRAQKRNFPEWWIS